MWAKLPARYQVRRGDRTAYRSSQSSWRCEGVPEVVARWIQGRQVEVITEGHGWIVDESKERRGDGLGPSPLGLLRSSLAA